LKFTNPLLILVGTCFLFIAFYRMSAIQFNRKMVIDLAPLGVGMVVLMCVAYHKGGTDLAYRGIERAGMMMGAYMPMLIIMFMVMGEALVMIDMHKAAMITYLNGSQGLWGSLFASYTMPGSLTSLPIVKELWDINVNRAPLLVFLLTSPLVGWQIMLIRQPMLGWRLTAIHFCLGTLLSLFVTWLAWAIMAIRKLV
jgi:hypothetical protein